MRALITGGAGFIGSHLADALLARGDSVILLDNLSTGRLENIEHLRQRDDVEFVLGSILNADLADASALSATSSKACSTSGARTACLAPRQRSVSWLTLSMTVVNMLEAKTQLSKLVARAEAGEDVVIARDGRPAVRLTPVQPGDGWARRIAGSLQGQIVMSEDFDEPMPEIEASIYGAAE